MNSITMNGAAMHNGVPFSKMQELMKGAMNFGAAIQKARDTNKTDASQSRNYDMSDRVSAPLSTSSSRNASYWSCVILCGSYFSASSAISWSVSFFRVIVSGS